MPHRILHLSDIHMTASGVDEDGVNAAAALDRMLHDCRHLTGLDAVVVTGDIADDGSAEGCALVRERVGQFAARRGIPHIYSTGNHDQRPAFSSALGTGHLGPDGLDVGVPLDGLEDECAAVSHLGGLRVITLDSLVPGSGHGYLSRAQLDALTAILQQPAPAGTVLALHHPPIYTPTAPPLKEVGLHNRAELEAAISGSDVTAVLCGHFHLQLTGRLGQATVSATPGVVTRIDLTAPHTSLEPSKGQVPPSLTSAASSRRPSMSSTPVTRVLERRSTSPTPSPGKTPPRNERPHVASFRFELSHIGCCDLPSSRM